MSSLFHISVTKCHDSAKYHNEVLTAFGRDNFMTSLCAATCRSVLPWSSSAISFGIILPYPPWLRFSCHSLSCSFVPLPCHAFGLPWSASILATALLTTAQVRSYSSLALYLTYSSCPALASPFQCRADLPWHFPDLSWLCLPLGCLGPALTLLILLYPHRSSLTPKSSLICIRAIPWPF